MSNKVPKDIIERVNKLRKLINDYRYHYHVNDESIMSEAAADSLKHELSQLEEQYPSLITPDSPTQRIAGVALDKFSKIQHKTQMTSLADVFNVEEIKAWTERMIRLDSDIKLEFFCDIKMDGLACSLVYEDGVLTQAVTRGNGFIGEDVTQNVRTIINVPLSLRRSSEYKKFLSGRTEIRGEVVIYKSDFELLNEARRREGQEEFKNPRNLAAGTIRQLNPQLVAERPLHFIGYDVIRDDILETPTIGFGYEVMSELGITTSRKAQVMLGVEEVERYVNELNQTRHDLPFNTDGAVIKLNDRKKLEDLGIVGKTPRAAVAFKYAAEETTAVVLDIVISIGRTGAATPVAVFEPVSLAGTTVQHASLHNADEIARLDVRIGDTVIVYKAGEIIPQIKEVLKDLRPTSATPFSYKSALKQQYPELEFERKQGDAVYRLKNGSSDLILKRHLEYFASKSVLDIDYLGEKNVSALVDAGLVKDVADIYLLSKDDLLKLDRFGDVSADKLLSAIKSRKEVFLDKFILSLGIRHVGAQTSVDLAEVFNSVDKLKNASLNELISVNGIGKKVAESIIIWFSEEDNLNLLTKLDEVGVRVKTRQHGTKLNDKSFVITGTLSSMSRDQAADKIRELGGSFQSSVSKETDYLVIGEKPGSSKLNKAKANGIEVINEAQLLKLLG